MLKDVKLFDIALPHCFSFADFHSISIVFRVYLLLSLSLNWKIPAKLGAFDFITFLLI